jgi:hypothetical protein
MIMNNLLHTGNEVLIKKLVEKSTPTELQIMFRTALQSRESYLKHLIADPSDIIRIANVDHSDKVFGLIQLVAPDNIRLIAADIAESVLGLYEAKYPSDHRPRLAIAAARVGDKEAASLAASAAYAAASDTSAYYAAASDASAAYASAADAYAAAYAAAAAAASASYARAAAAAAADAAAAARAAAYAAANAATYAAADADAYAATYAAARKKQEELTFSIIMKYITKKGR